MSIKGLLKKNVVLSNSGLVLDFNTKTNVLSLTSESYNLVVPIDLPSLEIVTFINQTIADAKKGYIQQAAWENPDIKLDGSLSRAEQIAFGYYIMLSFLNNSQCGTRDIWLVLRNVHHSLLSYVRHRAVAHKLLLRYKVAILSCYISDYGVMDIPKIERTFAKCGLSKQNYIFYLLMLFDRSLEDLKFDKQERFALSVETLEAETKKFIEHPQISKLCWYHTHKKLRFIVTSNKMNYNEMVNELQCATQVAYTTVRPLKTKEYSENYARRAMTNMVTRIIHAYTTYEEKKRLVADGDSFQNTVIQLEQDGASLRSHEPSFDHDFAACLHFNEDYLIDRIDQGRYA